VRAGPGRNRRDRQRGRPDAATCAGSGWATCCAISRISARSVAFVVGGRRASVVRCPAPRLHGHGRRHDAGRRASAERGEPVRPRRGGPVAIRKGPNSKDPSKLRWGVPANRPASRSAPRGSRWWALAGIADSQFEGTGLAAQRGHFCSLHQQSAASAGRCPPPERADHLEWHQDVVGQGPGVRPRPRPGRRRASMRRPASCSPFTGVIGPPGRDGRPCRDAKASRSSASRVTAMAVAWRLRRCPQCRSTRTHRRCRGPR